MAILRSVKQSHRRPDDQPLHGKGAFIVAHAPFSRRAVTEPLFRWKPYKVICCRPFIDQRRKTSDWNAENVFLKWLYQLFFYWLDWVAVALETSAPHVYPFLSNNKCYVFTSLCKQEGMGSNPEKLKP